MLSLGAYPEVGLAEARDRLDVERRRLRDGLDPSNERKVAEFAKRVAADNTFEAVADEWIAKFSPGWTKSHREKISQRFKLNVYPWIGDRAINTITAPQRLSVVRQIEGRGALDAAHRTLQNCGQVFRYAVATGRAERDPSGDLRGALPPVRVTNHASLKDPVAIGERGRSSISRRPSGGSPLRR